MRVALIATSTRVGDAFQNTSEHLNKYSGGNTGNFAFVHGLCTRIGSDFDLLPWHVHPDLVRERYDAIVIACANQLGPHTDLGALGDHLEKMKLPIIAIGLGAQAGTFDKAVVLSAGTKRWLEVIAAHSPSSHPNIGMRGEFSRIQVELQGFGDRAVVTGCPSNFINCDPKLPQILSEKFASPKLDRVAVPAGLHLWEHLRQIEQQLIALVDQTVGLYIAQSELDMLRLSRGELTQIEPNTLAAMNAYIKPDLNPHEFAVWCKRHATCYIDATSWLEAMRNFDFVVGPRIHGVMFAIQAGTPGGVIAHDSRTHELCQTMCIPVRHYSEIRERIELNNLRSLFEFDPEAFDKRRKELGKRIADMLKSGGIEPQAALTKLIAEVPSTPGTA